MELQAPQAPPGPRSRSKARGRSPGPNLPKAPKVRLELAGAPKPAPAPAPGHVETALLLAQTVFLLAAMCIYAWRVRAARRDVYATGSFFNVEALLAVAPTALVWLDPQCAWLDPQCSWLQARIPWYFVCPAGAGLWLLFVLQWLGSAGCPQEYVATDFLLLSYFDSSCNAFTSTRKCGNNTVPWCLSSVVAVLLHGLAGAATALVLWSLLGKVQRLLCVVFGLVLGVTFLCAVVVESNAVYCPHLTHNCVMLGVLGASLACLCCVGRWRQVWAGIA